MIVLARREACNETLIVESSATGVCRLECLDHCIEIGVAPAREVDRRTRFGIEQVVALILRIAHAKTLLDVLGEWMHLQGEVPAVHGVKKIEADGKLGPKAVIDRLAEQRPRLREDQIDRRNLDTHVAKLEKETVFLRHAIEAPGEIRLRAIEIADFLHPLPAPGSGIKKWRNAKGAAYAVRKRSTKALACHELRLIRDAGIEQEVPAQHRALLDGIAHAPVDEEGSLVLERRFESPV